MQTPEDSDPGTPDALHLEVQAGIKGVKESLKRSFEDYVSSNLPHATDKSFDPSKHLAFKAPSYVHTMEDIGFAASTGISPVAVSEPFQLFSEEAVNIMRSEIFHPVIQEKFSYTSDIAHKQLRGYAPQYAKFIYQAWTNPEVLSIISKIAGIELIPQMDYEIGHVNMSVAGKKSGSDNTVTPPGDDEEAIVGWHRDSYPFVCVLMMSDTTGMIGGETALRTGTGEIKKVRGPQKGCGVVLQGRYIDHQALAAFGGQERITMVTSFRPRSPHVRDDTVLNTVRPISNLSDLYGQTVQYQLENAETRIQQMLKTVRESMKTGSTNAAAIKKYLEFEIKTLQHLNDEIVDESNVQQGHVAEACVDAAKYTGV